MTQAFEAIAIEKVSAAGYLRAVFAAWRAARVVLPIDRLDGAVVPGVAIAAREAVRAGGGWFDERLEIDDSPYPAQISLTSGTTGTPKAILLSRRALSDVTGRLIAVQDLNDGVREYIGVPVTFSFGLGRARAIAAVGGRAFLPERGFRADELAAMLKRGEVNAFSAVPTLVRVVLQQSELFAGCGDKLKWLEIGSQAMAAQEKAAVAALFPAARIVQHYGLTEASRTTFLRIDERAALDSVGRPTGGAELRVDADQHIAIRGPHVADGVVTADGLVPLADPDGWLRTNDLGHVDDHGFVHYRGRADHVINVGGIKVPAELFEERLAAQIGGDAAHLAVAARADPLRGEAVMVAHLAHLPAARITAQARATGASFGLGAADVSLIEVTEIPRTETGKVRRGTLTEQYGRAAPPRRAAGERCRRSGDEPA